MFHLDYRTLIDLSGTVPKKNRGRPCDVRLPALVLRTSSYKRVNTIYIVVSIIFEKAPYKPTEQILFIGVACILTTLNN